MTTQDRSVITVRGPVPAASLGVTDAHDHLFLRTPALPGQEFDDLELSTAEVRAARATGISTVVELTPIGCGRRPDLMRALSEATGVHVVAASGYHRDAHYPSGHWVMGVTVDLMAERIVADLVDGMHPNDWLDPAQPSEYRPTAAG